MKMRWGVAIALVLAAAAMAGCDDADAPSAGPTASAPSTVTAELPFTLSQPIDAGAAMADEHLEGRSWFVVDVDSGLVQVLEDTYVNPCPTPADGSCIAHGGIISVRWHAPETLAVVPMYGEGYLIGLDGTSRGPATAAEPAGAPATSPDDLWHASVLASGPGGVLVSTVQDGGPGEAAYRISGATLPTWSSREPVLMALLANVCTGPDLSEGFDLALFEPNSGTLRYIEEAPDRLIPQYLWSPDGGTIAAGVVSTGPSETERRREISLIDVPGAVLSADTTFASRPLISISRVGELIPLEWSVDGRKLIVGYQPELGECDPSGVKAPGTKVEPLPRR
jgi:hypothetical protein